MNGPMLGTMISAFVASINAGDTMTITDAWDAVIQMQGQRALEQALEGFRSSLAIDPSSEQPWELPTSSEGLTAAYEARAAAAVRGLEGEMLERDEEIVAQLREGMAKEFKRLRDENDAKAATVRTLGCRYTWQRLLLQGG